MSFGLNIGYALPYISGPLAVAVAIVLMRLTYTTHPPVSKFSEEKKTHYYYFLISGWCNGPNRRPVVRHRRRSKCLLVHTGAVPGRLRVGGVGRYRREQLFKTSSVSYVLAVIDARENTIQTVPQKTPIRIMWSEHANICHLCRKCKSYKPYFAPCTTPSSHKSVHGCVINYAIRPCGPVS